MSDTNEQEFSASHHPDGLILEEDASPEDSDLEDDDEDGTSKDGESTSETKSTAVSSEEEQIKFTPEMTRNVSRLRVLVFCVLFLAATAVSVVVYMISNGGEKEEFKASYDAVALKVLETFEGIVTRKLDAVASLAIAVTAHGVDHIG